MLFFIFIFFKKSDLSVTFLSLGEFHFSINSLSQKDTYPKLPLWIRNTTWTWVHPYYFPPRVTAQTGNACLGKMIYLPLRNVQISRLSKLSASNTRPKGLVKEAQCGKQSEEEEQLQFGRGRGEGHGLWTGRSPAGEGQASLGQGARPCDQLLRQNLGSLTVPNCRKH